MPGSRLGREVLVPLGRETVEPGPALVLGHAPRRLDVATRFQSMERLVERAVIRYEVTVRVTLPLVNREAS